MIFCDFGPRASSQPHNLLGESRTTVDVEYMLLFPNELNELIFLRGQQDPPATGLVGGAGISEFLWGSACWKGGRGQVSQCQISSSHGQVHVRHGQQVPHQTEVLCLVGSLGLK